MNVSDFEYMWRGKVIKNLTVNDASLLEPIFIKNKNEGRALLLIHGFASSPAVYRELLPGISSEYAAISCPLLSGHGESFVDFASSRANNWLKSAADAYYSLLQEYSEVDIMALSLGGLLACEISKDIPPKNLYLLAPAIKLRGCTSMSLLLAQALRFLGLKKIKNKAGNIYTSGNQEISYRYLPLNAIIEILSFVKDYKFVVPNCHIEVFLGRFDEVVDSAAIANLFVNIDCANVHWLENSAHILPLDGDRDIIINKVLDRKRSS